MKPDSRRLDKGEEGAPATADGSGSFPLLWPGNHRLGAAAGLMSNCLIIHQQKNSGTSDGKIVTTK